MPAHALATLLLPLPPFTHTCIHTRARARSYTPTPVPPSSTLIPQVKWLHRNRPLPQPPEPQQQCSQPAPQTPSLPQQPEPQQQCPQPSPQPLSRSQQPEPQLPATTTPDAPTTTTASSATAATTAATATTAVAGITTATTATANANTVADVAHQRRLPAVGSAPSAPRRVPPPSRPGMWQSSADGRHALGTGIPIYQMGEPVLNATPPAHAAPAARPAASHASCKPAVAVRHPSPPVNVSEPRFATASHGAVSDSVPERPHCASCANMSTHRMPVLHTHAVFGPARPKSPRRRLVVPLPQPVTKPSQNSSHATRHTSPVVRESTSPCPVRRAQLSASSAHPHHTRKYGFASAPAPHARATFAPAAVPAARRLSKPAPAVLVRGEDGPAVPSSVGIPPCAPISGIYGQLYGDTRRHCAPVSGIYGQLYGDTRRHCHRYSRQIVW